MRAALAARDRDGSRPEEGRTRHPREAVHGRLRTADDPSFKGNAAAKEPLRAAALASARRMLEAEAAGKGRIFYAENWVFAPVVQKEVEIITKTKAQILWMMAEESHWGPTCGGRRRGARRPVPPPPRTRSQRQLRQAHEGDGRIAVDETAEAAQRHAGAEQQQQNDKGDDGGEERGSARRLREGILAPASNCGFRRAVAERGNPFSRPQSSRPSWRREGECSLFFREGIDRSHDPVGRFLRGVLVAPGRPVRKDRPACHSVCGRGAAQNRNERVMEMRAGDVHRDHGRAGCAGPARRCRAWRRAARRRAARRCLAGRCPGSRPL